MLFDRLFLVIWPKHGSCAFRLRVMLYFFRPESAVFLFAVSCALHFIALAHCFSPFRVRPLRLLDRIVSLILILLRNPVLIALQLNLYG